MIFNKLKKKEGTEVLDKTVVVELLSGKDFIISA